MQRRKREVAGVPGVWTETFERIPLRCPEAASGMARHAHMRTTAGSGRPKRRSRQRVSTTCDRRVHTHIRRVLYHTAGARAMKPRGQAGTAPRKYACMYVCAICQKQCSIQCSLRPIFAKLTTLPDKPIVTTSAATGSRKKKTLRRTPSGKTKCYITGLLTR